MTRIGLKARLAAAGAVALALAACDDRGSRVDVPEPAPLAELSAAGALPYAEPARVDYLEPAQGYAWAERAYGLQRAVYDTPPDYGFDYGDVEPLAWVTEDEWVMYAEPWDDGYRYYYYEPGEEYPYFIRDDDYGYGYGDGGVLVAVFDAGGRYLPVDVVYQVAPLAGRYYVRGHDLRSAGRRAPRIRVTEQIWAERAPQVIRTADPWLRAARDDRQWRAWRERDQDRELRRFEPEAARRAERTRQWREQDDGREAASLRVNQDQWRREAGDRQQQAERQRIQVDRQRAGDRQRWEQAQQDQRRQADRAQVQRQRQAERQQVQQAEQQRRQRADRQRQEVEQHQRAEQQAQQQRQRADQQRQHAERQQRQQAEQQRQHVQQQRQQAEHRQREQAHQQRQQAEQRQQAHQQRQQMDQQRQRQAGQQRQRAEQQRQPQRPQAQARAAEQQGQPAAGRERGGGGGQGKGRGHDRKD